MSIEGKVTVNGTDLTYLISPVGDEYEMDIFGSMGSLGSLPMEQDDVDNLDLIYVDETIYSAAECGLLPDVAKYCNIKCIYEGVE